MLNFKTLQPKQKGEITEQVILTEFIKRGIPCSKPLGDNQPYDLIVDVNGKLYKIQCRTARLKGKTEATVEFNCLSCRNNMSKVYIKDSRDKFDFFAACIPDVNSEVYIVQSKDTPNSCCLALAHNRLKNNKKAEDYTLDKWLEKVK